MGYKQLTQKGKEYIKKTITKNGNYTFTGKNDYAVKYSNIPKGTNITSKAYDDNGNQTTDASKFADLIIKWTEQYSKQYELDSNILSAQQKQESKFLPWNYSTSGAMGFTQFTTITIIEWIFTKKSISQEEIDILSNGINGDITKKSTYFTSSNQSQEYNQIRLENFTTLFQNVIDNPKIMIHAQASLMAYISDRNNKIASSSLFAYNRGSSLKSTSYVEIIPKMANLEKKENGVYIKYGREYTEEGLKYVNSIFENLNKNYGYNLDLTKNDVATKEVNIRTQNT